MTDRRTDPGPDNMWYPGNQVLRQRLDFVGRIGRKERRKEERMKTSTVKPVIA